MSSVAPGYPVEYNCVPDDEDLDVGRSENLALSDIASSADVSSIASFPEYDVHTNIDVKELKSLIAQLFKTKGPDLIQACKNYDRRSTGKILKSHLKQVIRIFCIPITAVQFDCLLKELNMNTDEKINYQDFFSQFSSKKIFKTTKTLAKIPDNLPMDEVELIIKEKIKNNLRNVIRSFWLFDVNKDGFIQKAELRRIIRNYCFELSDEVYNDLWKYYDPKMTGLINYKDFLIRLGINASRYQKHVSSQSTANSLCWKENLRGCEPFDRSWEPKCRQAALENRDDPAIQGLPLEEVAIIFLERLQKQSRVLKEVFKIFDSEGSGEVSLSDFRGIINFFVVAMSTRLFNLVMKKLNIDVSSDGLAYESFLSNFCQSDFQDSFARKSEKVDICAPIVQRIKNRVLNPEARLCSVFTKINTDQEWQITRPELKKALEIGLDFKLTDEEFKDLMTILDPGNTNIIKCADFIHLFEDSCNRDCIERRESDTELKKDINAEKCRHLKGKKLQTRVKHHLNKNINNIEKAILVCDSDHSGFILPEKLKDILSTFCFPLSDEQFEDIISNIRRYRNTINYHEFFTLFKKSPNEDTHKWISVVEKLVSFKSRCPPEMLITEVEEMIRDCIHSRRTAILKDFKALDMCNVGIVSKDDCRNVLSKFVCRLTDKQYEALWETFPRNQYNQLLYDKFLEKYTSYMQQSVYDNQAETRQSSEEKQNEMKDEKKASAQSSVRKSSTERNKGLVKKNAENRKTTKEIFYSQAPHLKNVFQSMETTVIRNFRTIQYHIRRADPKVTDMVDFITLKNILEKCGITISSEDEFHILEHFDPYLAGKINYRDFLRIFVWYA